MPHQSYTQHLDEVNTTYFEHLGLAIFNSLRLIAIPPILIIHGITPFLFTKTSSNLLKSVLYSFPRSKGDRILVRFNTKWGQDPLKRQWRVLTNGQEKLAEKVVIREDVETISEPVNNEPKFHFLMHGHSKWEENKVEIF